VRKVDGVQSIACNIWVPVARGVLGCFGITWVYSSWRGDFLRHAGWNIHRVICMSHLEVFHTNPTVAP